MWGLPRPVMEPISLALQKRILNHWTIREVPGETLCAEPIRMMAVTTVTPAAAVDQALATARVF